MDDDVNGSWLHPAVSDSVNMQPDGRWNMRPGGPTFAMPFNGSFNTSTLKAGTRLVETIRRKSNYQSFYLTRKSTA
eukprot:scaffold86786_cov48-Prasinocladus_malaysianus.AAC.1